MPAQFCATHSGLVFFLLIPLLVLFDSCRSRTNCYWYSYLCPDILQPNALSVAGYPVSFHAVIQGPFPSFRPSPIQTISQGSFQSFRRRPLQSFRRRPFNDVNQSHSFQSHSAVGTNPAKLYISAKI